MAALQQAPTSNLQAALLSMRASLRVLKSNPLTVAGALILALLVAMAVFAPLLAPHGPYDQDLARRLLPPSADNLLGTDELGRDLLSRIIYGTRLTLMVALTVVAISAPVGLIVGAVSGYLGGVVDVVLMRITDIFLAFPRLILALALIGVLGSGITNAIIAIALTSWPIYARIARAETLTFRKADFIAAIEAQGASTSHIVARHVIPLCLPSLVIRTTLDMSGIILTAAGLGFLGLGAQPPSPEWGTMISTGRKFMLDQWWVAAMPGVAILLASLAFNLLGDGLRDALDPRGK